MYLKLVFLGGNWAVGPDVNIPYGVTFNLETKKMDSFICVRVAVVKIFRGNHQKIEFVSG